MGDRDRYIHLKEIFVYFVKRRPTSVLELVFKDETGVKYKSSKFKEGDLVHWDLDTYVRSHTYATLTIQRALFKISVAQINIELKPNEFGDYKVVGLEDSKHRVTVNFKCGRSKSLTDVTHLLGTQARTNPAPNDLRFLKHPQLAALPLATSKKGDNEQYPALYWLNDNILLGIFNCYRVDDERLWNHRLGWCKLSHVCQRWRHLLHECAFHLGMHIECTNGTPIVDTLDHLPPLPLVVYYRTKDMRFCPTILTEQDESGIYHVLQLHDRVRQLDLHLPPFILHKVIMHMDKHFPILEHLSLSFPAQNGITLALPKAFLAPNLRHLALPGISPPRRLQLLTSTVSLVKIELLNIQTSSYFRPRLLVARLRSLPHLEKLSIEFSIPIPLPGTERELLGEEGAPVTLPSLKRLRFQGVSAYLESLITQIRVPLLEQLDIKLFNELAFALPHLCHLLNTTKRFKFPIATVCFCHNKVSVTGTHRSWPFAVLRGEPFSLHVLCSQLDRQINCAAHIFHALLPSLSGVEQFKIFPYNKWPIRTEFDTGGLDTYCELLKSWLGLTFDDSPWEELYRAQISTEFENGAIDGTTWHELLRSFIRLKELYIDGPLLEELSRALQLDEVGSDPGFLPRLRSIHTGGDDNLFTSFINTRQVVGRPVEFMKW